MKRCISVLLILAFMAVALADCGYCQTPLRKLGRGIANCFTAPLEVPHRINETNETSGALEAVSYGLVYGLAMMTFRVCSGMIEIATFPIPIPKNYEPVLKDPEFFIEWPKSKTRSETNGPISK